MFQKFSEISAPALLVVLGVLFFIVSARTIPDNNHWSYFQSIGGPSPEETVKIGKIAGVLISLLGLVAASSKLFGWP